MIFERSKTTSLLEIGNPKYYIQDYALAAAHLTLTCLTTMCLIPVCARVAHKRLLNTSQ